VGEDRRKCNPDKCLHVHKERRKGKKDRRKLHDERVRREYYEEEATAYRDAIQMLVKKIFGRK
jgi:hypothetical protein